MDVVLDTNALLLPFTDGTDLRSECERIFGAVALVVPSCVEQELARLAERGGPNGANAKAAVRYSQRMARAESTLPGDDGVLQVAAARGAAVVTNDRTLQREAARRGLRVAAARGPGQLYEIR